MDKKKILLIGSIVIIVISVIISIVLLVNNSNEKKDDEFTIDGILVPENEDILKDATVGDLKITNVSLLTRNGISTFKALVSNNTDKNISSKTLNIIFYEDEEKIEVTKNITIASGNSMYINIESEIDLSKTTKIDYVLE